MNGESTYDKATVNRIARATGHLKSIHSMVETGRDCAEVLIQLSAVKSAVNNTGREILKQYLDECLNEEKGQCDPEKIKELTRAIEILLK